VPASGYPQTAALPGSYPGYPVPQPKPRAPKLGLWSAILGAVGVVGGIVFGWTLPFAVAAVIMGAVARKKEAPKTGPAIAGIITGLVGIVLSAGWFVYSIIVLTSR